MDANYIDAPRIQIVLRPIPLERYEVWLVLYVPDGREPNTVRLGHDSYDRNGAVKMILDVYTSIGEQFAFDGTVTGSESTN